jgi:hypothetical protein
MPSQPRLPFSRPGTAAAAARWTSDPLRKEGEVIAKETMRLTVCSYRPTHYPRSSLSPHPPPFLLTTLLLTFRTPKQRSTHIRALDCQKFQFPFADCSRPLRSPSNGTMIVGAIP